MTQENEMLSCLRAVWRELIQADLTDRMITPMIPIGIGVTVFLIVRTTAWSLPVAFAVGLVPGAILGFHSGLLLFIVLSTAVDVVDKVKQSRQQRKNKAHRSGGSK